MPEKLEFDRKQLVLRVQAGRLGDYRQAGSTTGGAGVTGIPVGISIYGGVGLLITISCISEKSITSYDVRSRYSTMDRISDGLSPLTPPRSLLAFVD